MSKKEKNNKGIEPKDEDNKENEPKRQWYYGIRSEMRRMIWLMSQKGKGH